MAAEEQLAILKQGVEVWNKWRKENRRANINLSHADLRSTNLTGAYLSGADLSHARLDSTTLIKSWLTGAYMKRANLNKADLAEAYLNGADLTEATLNRANLKRADLSDTNLNRAHIARADLSEADLRRAKVSDANLYRAKLIKTKLFSVDFSNSSLRGATFTGAHLDAHLVGADLSGADLKEAFLGQAILGGTLLGSVDLSETVDLSQARHLSASSLGIDTIQLSKGKISKRFLRGCGLSDWEIEAVKLYDPNLDNQDMDEILYRIHDLRARQPIQISQLFISYSHADGAFVDKIENDLNKEGIRFWRDVHDATAGRLEKQIDRAMRLNPTVLLIISEYSLKSDWVEHEVRTARQLEKELGRDVLCPVALDDSWKSSPWPKRLMEQVMEYNVLDFSAWRDESKFANVFRKLIDGLELFYKRS